MNRDWNNFQDEAYAKPVLLAVCSWVIFSRYKVLFCRIVTAFKDILFRTIYVGRHYTTSSVRTEKINSGNQRIKNNVSWKKALMAATIMINMSLHMTQNLTTTEEIPTFMEEVQTHMTYIIASYVNQYWFPILVPIGLIGNTLSFLVMIKPNNRNVSTCIYMAAISVSDNLMMFLTLHEWLLSGAKIEEWHVWRCKFAAYLINFSLQSSTYQVLAMTFDKYVAIKWPHRAATYSTPKRAKLILISVFLFALVYNSPHLYASSLVGGLCLAYVVGGTITKVFSWVTFLFNGLIPFPILIYMNSVILHKIKISKKMFRSNDTGRNIYANKVMDTRQRTMKSAENQLTIMLLLVTMLFLILLIPTYIRFIYLTFVERDTPSKYASSMLFFQVTYKLYTTNSGINFFLYCLSGQKFRNDVKEILCAIVKCCGPSLIEITSINGSESNITDLSA